MRIRPRLRALVRNLFRRAQVDRDLSAELESYVDLVADEQRARGVDASTARRAARLDLGGVAPVTEAVRASRAGAGLERLWQDGRYAWRGLRRAPGFATMAAAMLALGIGANTAIFSVADAAMFKPLPYKDPEQLVELAEVTRRGTAEETFAVGLTWSRLDRWREQTQVFSRIETFRGGLTMRIEGDASVGPTIVGRVSPGLVDMLGLDAIIGRRFVAADARPDPAVVMLTEGYWQRAFKSDRSVIGRDLTLNGRPYAIVGVMPASLAYRLGGSQFVAWLPFDETTARLDTSAPYVGAIHRLRPGLTLAAAERELDAAATRLQQAMPAASKWEVDLMPLDSRTSSLGTTRTALFVLLGAVACVLLIACANIANLMLSRVFARQREVAVRAALGATRGRLLRQFLTEGLVLALLGGAGAVVLAWWLVTAAPTLVPGQFGLFRANAAALDGRALAFCGAAVLLTALLCSLVPAFRASRSDITQALEGSSRVAGATPGARRLRLGLQAIEVALTLILLTGAGLLTASFVRMMHTEPGFDVNGLASATVSLPKDRYPLLIAQREFYDTLLSRVKSLPLVHAATYGPPPTGSGGGRFIVFGREQNPPAGLGSAYVYSIDPDYFSVTGIPVLEGRLFTADDGPGNPPVALIDEHAARAAWPGQSPLGQRFRYSPLVPWLTVVGVVGPVKTKNFTQGTVQVYTPRLQTLQDRLSGTLTLRANGDPVAAFGAVRAIVRDLDPALTLTPPALSANAYDSDFATPRFYLTLMVALGALALLTAMVGLYGVMNYSVTQRAREIGVRLALGASRGRIQNMVLREALAPVLAGTAAGLVGAWWLSTFLVTLLYEVGPRDPLTFASAVALVIGVAMAAAWLPARRATRVDPVRALRLE
jgi:putative ABC transport system permease protein